MAGISNVSRHVQARLFCDRSKQTSHHVLESGSGCAHGHTYHYPITTGAFYPKVVCIIPLRLMGRPAGLCACKGRVEKPPTCSRDVMSVVKHLSSPSLPLPSVPPSRGLTKIRNSTNSFSAIYASVRSALLDRDRACQVHEAGRTRIPAAVRAAFTERLLSANCDRRRGACVGPPSRGTRGPQGRRLGGAHANQSSKKERNICFFEPVHPERLVLGSSSRLEAERRRRFLHEMHASREGGQSRFFSLFRPALVRAWHR